MIYYEYKEKEMKPSPLFVRLLDAMFGLTPNDVEVEQDITQSTCHREIVAELARIGEKFGLEAVNEQR
jgi:hypothetical protein|tara:strand:- start:35 stop:238 length:204 start_codon:yes stop_codon:yes gene_type:complete